MNVLPECLIYFNLVTFSNKFRHKYGIPCLGQNVNILSLDQSNSQKRKQTDGTSYPTARIEVGNFASMILIKPHD